MKTMNTQRPHVFTAVLAFLLAGALSSCVAPSRIASKEQTFRRPVVVSLMGSKALIRKIGATSLTNASYTAEVPEWRMDETLENTAVSWLKSRGIAARAAGGELRGKFQAAAFSSFGGTEFTNAAKCGKALPGLNVPDADAVLVLADGLEPLPTGGLTMVGGYGMCEVSALGFGNTYMFAPVQGWAFANPSGKRLGFSVGKGVLKVALSKQMRYVRPWESMPAGQKDALRSMVESAARESLERALTKLGL